MNYYFTTLAIGEEYLKQSLLSHIHIHELTKDAYFNITTSKSDINNIEEIIGLSLQSLILNYPRIQITYVENYMGDISFPFFSQGYGSTFNYNMKVLSFKFYERSEIEFDYLIFMDGDWKIHENFSEEKLKTFFLNMENNNIDFAFERPAKIGNYRQNNFEDCFFDEKLRDYNVLEHNIWDDAHVVNEQFLVFKNNWKLKLFTQKWEQMLWYSIVNKIRNYAEGFEIGVSALESKMNYSWQMFYPLTECFFFYAKYSENKYIKF